MSDKPLLVLPPRYTEDSIALGGAANRAGWEVERLMGWRAAAWMAERNVAAYGEPLFVAAVADALGILALEPTSEWLAELPREYRQRDIRLMRLSEARGEIRSRAFVKPAVDKCFAARVYESAADLPTVHVWPENTLVFVSDVVEWGVEWRCFVLNRDVATASPYWRQGRLARLESGEWASSDEEEREALAFAARVLADTRVKLPPAVVVDVGRLSDGRWAVIEANSAWGGGVIRVRSGKGAASRASGLREGHGGNCGGPKVDC